MMKVVIDYPTDLEEFVIVERMTGRLGTVKEVLSAEDLIQLRGAAERVYVDPSLIEFAVRLVAATRSPQRVGLPELARYITYGASPRASINLILTARALAFLRGRDYALPQDVADMALDVMRHRIVLSYEALSDGMTGDAIIQAVLERLPQPQPQPQPARDAPSPEQKVPEPDVAAGA
jgi:MoxR-like ATPase